MLAPGFHSALRNSPVCLRVREANQAVIGGSETAKSKDLAVQKGTLSLLANAAHKAHLSSGHYMPVLPEPPIRAVSSSSRSTGNGGAHSGFSAMDISFMGLSSAATRLEPSFPQSLHR